MNWKTTEPPKDMQLLAYGHPIADFSGLRGDITHAIVEWNDWKNAWQVVDHDEHRNAMKIEIVGCHTIRQSA